MVTALAILSTLCFVSFIVMADLWYSHRQWVAIWRGHRIRVRTHRAKIFIEVDDVEVFVETNSPIQQEYKQDWEHPALGKTNIQLNKIVKGSDGLDFNLTIGNEIIPLTEIKRTWYGKLNPNDAAQYWEKLRPVYIEPLGDPRWIAASRILQRVRQSNAANERVRQASNALQIELRKSFETKRRLGEEDVQILGDDARFANLQDKIEENISHALEAVKSLHMAVVSIEAHADEDMEMQRVQSIIEELQAEEEVNVVLSSPSEKASSKARKIKRQDKKL